MKRLLDELLKMEFGSICIKHHPTTDKNENQMLVLRDNYARKCTFREKSSEENHLRELR